MGMEYKLRSTPSLSPVLAQGTAKTSPLASSLKQTEDSLLAWQGSLCLMVVGGLAGAQKLKVQQEDLKLSCEIAGVYP